MKKIIICKLVRDLVFTENPLTGDNESIVARNCIFKEDFGPWKTHQRIEVLLFDFEHGDIEERLESGDLVKRAKLKLTIDE